MEPERLELHSKVSPAVPKHVAIIMDGNGRWAKARLHPRVYGHIRGATRVKPVVREAKKLGIQALTLFAFSTENWTRPDEEVSVLWKLLDRYLLKEAESLAEENVRLHVIGEVHRLAPELRRRIEETVEKLSRNDGFQLTFAISYGGRREILAAAKKLVQDCVSQKRDVATLDENDFADCLWTAHLGPLSNVDLVIRTSGEMRISNFLLWQAAYAEYIFLKECWPDFLPRHFRGAVEEFALRQRRFGGVNV